MARMFLKKTLLTVLLAVFVTGTALPATAGAVVSDWQQGASIYPRTTGDIASPAGLAAIDQLAASGANFATIIIPYYQSSFTSHDLHPGYDTPTDAAILTAVAHARALGMQVMLKPHMEVTTGGWRAHINPADRAAWNAAYQNMLLHYARLGESAGASQLCVGSELVNVSSSRVNAGNTAAWQNIIAAVRAEFSGTLTYSAQRPGPMGELETIRFWPQLDYIGTSGYFPLGVSGEPTVENLQAAWSRWEAGDIRPVQQQYGKPVLFTEIGYRSLEGSYNDPWSYERQGAVSERHQALAYEAFHGFWNNVGYMYGVHLWDWEPDATAGGPASSSYTAQNKEAGNVLAKWWEGGGRGGVAPAPEAAPTPAPAPAPAEPAPAPVEEPTAAAPADLHVWWPSADVPVSGTQPFKALVAGMSLDQYDMFWRVDNGVLNPMGDSDVDWPHKEAPVGLDAWLWSPTGTYNVEFVAKDKAGVEIGTATVPVRVNQ